MHKHKQNNIESNKQKLILVLAIILCNYHNFMGNKLGKIMLSTVCMDVKIPPDVSLSFFNCENDIL